MSFLQLSNQLAELREQVGNLREQLQKCREHSGWLEERLKVVESRPRPGRPPKRKPADAHLWGIQHGEPD